MATPRLPVELVAIRRTVPTTSGRVQAPRRKLGRMVIAPEGSVGTAVVVPYAPRNVDHSGIGGDYAEISRPGLSPVVFHKNEQLPRMSFQLMVVDKDLAGSLINMAAVTTAMAIIEAIQNFARNGIRVRVTYGKMESGLWYIDDLSLQSVQRHPVTDEITQALIDISFIRASEVSIGIGPITGGVRPPAPPKPPKPAAQTSARYYTMKYGDTLFDVSVKFYGTGSKWRTIADANGIKNPRAIPVGKVVRIP